jgi:tetratricopeptide (TPR) repeat protein
MTYVRAASLILLTAAVVALAQNDDIFDRLRRALGPFGEGELAARALSNKDFAQVESLLAAAKPDSKGAEAELLSLRAAVEFLDGKMRESATTYQEAGKLAPLRDSDNFTLAMALVKAGDDAGARALLNSLATKHPDRSVYPYWLGRLDYDQRLYKEAVEKLEQATKLDPRSARIWDSLGLALDMQGELEQARDKFEKAASLNRGLPHPSPWPPHDLGYLLLRMDQLQEAEADLREAIRYDGQFPEAHYHLGRVLEKEGHDSEAIEEYSRAITLDKTSADACYSLGSLYRRLNRNAEASAMFSEYRKRKGAETQSGAQSH